MQDKVIFYNVLRQYHKLIIGLSLLPVIAMMCSFKSIDSPGWIGNNFPLSVGILMILLLDVNLYSWAKKRT